MRRIAYLGGLILGSGVFAYLLGSALIYLFTGKVSSIRMNEDGRPRLVLVDIDTLYEAPTIVPGRTESWAERGGA